MYYGLRVNNSVHVQVTIKEYLTCCISAVVPNLRPVLIQISINRTFTSMAKCKTVLTPLLTDRCYCTKPTIYSMVNQHQWVQIAWY